MNLETVKIKKMLTKQKQIQHLYWRAGFGINKEELNEKLNQPIEKTIAELFQAAEKTSLLNSELGERYRPKSLTLAQRSKLRKKARIEAIKVNSNWVKQMATTDNPLFERMTLFWYGHFACTIRNKPYMSEMQNNTIRKHALGSFKDLLLAIAKDPAMLRFLNNQQNNKNKPNENFARELLELYTIGRGNYTETDIKEAARAFTGWKSNQNMEFVFSKRQHDFEEKTFFGETGNFDGEDIIDILLKNKQTARFISTKVYRYFVNTNLNETHIEQLTNVFYDSNYNIKTLMQAVFESDWFYKPENIGTKIKSPIDLLVGVMQTFSVKFEQENAIFFIQKVLGQTLFDPPNVAGWAGGRAWIDNATLLIRLNLVNYLFQATDLEIAAKPEFEALRKRKSIKRLEATLNIDKLTKQLKKKDETIIFEELKNWIIQPDLKLNKSEIDVFTINDNPTNYIQSLMIRLMTLPEYQMC